MTGVAITAAAGRLPGAPDLEAYAALVRAARPAPLVDLGARWGLPPARYRTSPEAVEPGRTYLDRAFGCEVPEAADRDRQEVLGALVLADLFARRARAGDPPARARTALVLATAWAGESYFEHDAARALAGLLPAGACPAPAAPPSSPERLLEVLATGEGLGGPRLAIDTACASSLYALDVGLGLLAQGAADAVVVCGLTGFLPLFLHAGFSKLRALSPRAELLPFARDASGIVLGEGAGAVLLEPEGAARRPLARILGLGLSCDGAERSVFAPAADGQRRAYLAAYRDVDPRSVDYVEAHGTATALGDETELSTLDAFFGPGRGRPLPVGSVKGLVGHLLAAAGMASLLKVLAMLAARELPPHLPVAPHPRLAGTCCELLAAARPWERGDHPRRAGISAFGFGGSNAHLVLEEGELEEVQEEGALEAGAVEVGRPRARAPLALHDVVLRDVAAAFGAAPDEAAVQRCIARQEPAFSSFSTERFGRDRVALGAAPEAAVGAYLPARLPVETAGHRVGPNLLARLDPLQLLVTSLAQRLLARGGVDPRRTAAVLVSNLGGATALRLYRRGTYEARARAPEPGVARFLGPEITSEAIATALTPMCSGYPAFLLGLEAMHATLSGAPGSFLDALALAPHYLGAHADALLLGAARLVKGPLELSEPCPQGEGAALLLLGRAEDGPGAPPPLARLRALTPGGAAAACRAAGVALEALSAVEVTELAAPGSAGQDPLEESPGAGVQVQGAGVQALFGALAEASGTEGLLRLLARGAAGELGALELRRAGEPLATLLIEQLRPWRPEPAPPARPREVPFVEHPLEAREPAPPPSGEDGLGLAHPLGVALVHGAAAVRRFFELQRRALALLDPAPPATSSELASRPALQLEPARRDPSRRVLRDAREEAGELRATLVVDEQHPYYFDHPLDHVPGILLVEGALQLAEASAARRLSLGPGEAPLLSELSLRFRRWCEKDAPIALTLVPRATPHEGALLRCEGRAEQGGQVVATISLEVARAPLPAPTLERGAADEEDGAPPRALLHKHRPENVLVRALVPEGDPGGPQHARLIPPPLDHALAAEDPRLVGGLYLLETARQAVMLAAHGPGGIPLGRPMNLIAAGVSQRRPLRREESLRWVIAPQPSTRIGGTILADIRAELRAGAEVVGEARVKAQVVDEETYEAQRRTT
ncbi:MAG: beta-ketoacyl synthase N-terminal-like domain-containing protein [Planctomycetota bacterium]